MLNTIALIVIVTIFIELITLSARFSFKMSSKGTMINFMKRYHLKFIPHFHHGLLGILLIALFFVIGYKVFLVLGPSLILSDAFHHLFILWPIVGHPEFHLIYKNKKFYKQEQIKDDKIIKKFFNHLIHHS